MIGRAIDGITGIFDRFASSAVLLREAARTSRRWQTYASRAGFSGALFGVLLLSIWSTVNVSGELFDVSDMGWMGKAIFTAFSVVLLLMATLLAPLTTSAAIIEETEDRTLEMLILSKLQPSQILAGKVLSRILILITIVFGAMPVMAMVVTLGGVAPEAVVAVTVHTLVAVVVSGALGAFYGLFTRSPMLAMLASAAYALPVFWLLPIGYIICTGHPNDAVHFSLFSGPFAEDWTSPVAVLSYIPSLVIIQVIGTRLFELKVSSADIRKAFAAETWSTKAWAWGVGIALLTGCTVLPMATVAAWMLRFSNSGGGLLQQAGIVGAVAVIWLWWTLALTLLTWALLRVGVDVVDALDAILGGRGKKKHGRRDFHVWSNPILWREARPAAWGQNGVPVIVTWLLIMLGMLQTGWWIIPGGSLAMGVMNTVAALGLTLWLSAKTIEEERKNKSLEVLLTTTLPSWRVLLGKAGGVMVPTLPLLMLSLPFIAFGVPHLQMIGMLEGNDHNSFTFYLVRGILTWLWTLPLWGVLLFGGLWVALRVKRRRSGFAVAIGGLLMVLGVPMVVGRLFDHIPLIAVPCRVFVPPLAGSAEVWHYLVSSIAWSILAVFLFIWTSVGLRRWIAGSLVVLLALSIGLSSPAMAQQPAQKVQRQDDFLMLAEPFGDGLVREDGWSAVRVKVQNLGPNARGQVSIVERNSGDDRTYSRTVDLPQGVRKDVILLYRPGSSSRERQVTLTAQGRLAVARFPVRHATPRDATVGIFGVDRLGVQKIRESLQGRIPGPRPRGTDMENPTVHVGLIEPGVLPNHSAAYSGFDQLLWPKADPSELDPGQITALKHYVADGGHLILTVTENWRALEASPLSELLPVTYTGTEDRDDLTPVLRLLGGRGLTDPSPVARSTVKVKPGRQVFVRAESAEGLPIWVTGSYGLGSLTVFNADPRVAPFKGNVPTEQLWRSLLHLPSDSIDVPYATVGSYAMGNTIVPLNDPQQALRDVLHTKLALGDTILDGTLHFQTHTYGDSPFMEFENAVRQWLADIPGVAPLPMSWLLAFSGVYLFVIGPLDWFLLRLIRKQPWTWVTFPITIVVFSAAALGGTAYMKGSQAMVSTLEVVDLLPGTDLWRGDAYVGVFATRHTRIGLSTTVSDSTAEPLMESGYTLQTSIGAGLGPGTFAYTADTWTLAYARMNWMDTAPGGIEFTPETDGWTVTNTLPFALDDAALVISGPSSYPSIVGVYPIGRIASGESRLVSAELRQDLTTSSANSDDGLRYLTELALDAPSPGHGYLDVNGLRMVLLGTAERQTPLSIDGVSPIHRTLTLIRAPLLPPLDPSQRGGVAIPGLHSQEIP